MAQGSVANQGQQFAAKAAAFSRAVLKIVSEDVRTWDVFRWVVIALLALNLLLLLSSGGIKSEIAALKDERKADAEQIARLTKDIADARASLTQAISDMRSGLQSDIAKVNTKLDVRVQPAPKPSPPPSATPKPAKPKPQ
jgi:hypothetical protein